MEKTQKQRKVPKQEQELQELKWHQIKGTNSTFSIWHRPSKNHINILKKNYDLSLLITCQVEKEDIKSLQIVCNQSSLEWFNIPINGANSRILNEKQIKNMINQKLTILQEKIKNQEKIKFLIHCAAGVHRTGIISYSLLRINGYNEEETMKVLQELRLETFKNVGEERIKFAEQYIVQRILNADYKEPENQNIMEENQIDNGDQKLDINDIDINENE